MVWGHGCLLEALREHLILKVYFTPQRSLYFESRNHQHLRFVKSLQGHQVCYILLSSRDCALRKIWISWAVSNTSDAGEKGFGTLAISASWYVCLQFFFSFSLWPRPWHVDVPEWWQHRSHQGTLPPTLQTSPFRARDVSTALNASLCKKLYPPGGTVESLAKGLWTCPSGPGFQTLKWGRGVRAACAQW